mgnify:CR=1 FL=1
MAQRKTKVAKSEEIRTVTATYYNRFTGKTIQRDIRYLVKQNPPQGSMKKTFFSTDGEWAISFFHDPGAAIEKGIKPTGGQYEVIENRREAIRKALEMAEDGDVIVLAGKGHETYQEIMGVKRPFDEKVIVSEILLEMRKREESV